MQQQSLWDVPEEQPQPRELHYGDTFELTFAAPDWMTPEEYVVHLERKKWMSMVTITGDYKRGRRFDARFLALHIEGSTVVAQCQLVDMGAELFGRKHAIPDEEDDEEDDEECY